MIPITILLIDDDASVIRLLTHRLKRDGHKVTAASSLALARAYLESHAPEIVPSTTSCRMGMPSIS